MSRKKETVPLLANCISAKFRILLNVPIAELLLARISARLSKKRSATRLSKKGLNERHFGKKFETIERRERLIKGDRSFHRRAELADAKVIHVVHVGNRHFPANWPETRRSLVVY